MQIYQTGQFRKSSYFSKCVIATFSFFMINHAFANVVITGNQNINTATTYNNTTLDMSNGRFTINTGGTLTIQNSTINVTISPSNPFFTAMTNGSLVMNNNIVNVTVSGITPNPNSQSLYPIMPIQQGSVNLNGNTFTTDTDFTVSLLQTNVPATTNFSITNNTIKHFHGGLYLNNSSNATVSGNTFWNVSFSNIYNSGQLNNFNNNIFYFPGNLRLGDAIDLINATGVNIQNNIISSSSNYGIYIMGGQNISIDNNKIVDGLSYGISIPTSSLQKVNNKSLAQLLSKKKLTLLSNSNIVINNNYISLNRYGLSGGVINQLIVTGNTFIQRFSDSSIRQYWTNNDILLPSASNVTWANNLYKEAFTQDVPGDNSNALSFVTFPQHGGVFIP